MGLTAPFGSLASSSISEPSSAVWPEEALLTFTRTRSLPAPPERCQPGLGKGRAPRRAGPVMTHTGPELQLENVPSGLRWPRLMASPTCCQSLFLRSSFSSAPKRR